jgi:hypothetical protein
LDGKRPLGTLLYVRALIRVPYSFGELVRVDLVDLVDVCHGSAARRAVSNFAVFQRKERVVPTQPHVLTGVNAGSNLSHENRTGRNRFAPEDLHPTPLAIAIATVS